jgi:hypothetical protein
VSSIGANAFRDLTTLEFISLAENFDGEIVASKEMGNSIRTIGNYAFYGESLMSL